MKAHARRVQEGSPMSRLPLNLPSAAPARSARSRRRDGVFFVIAFATVFLAALLVMEMMLG